jgi:hypothetical protein
MLETNCDTAQGNSGGALLAAPTLGAPQLLAVTIGFMAKGDRKKSRNAPEDGPYRHANWSCLSLALTGQFRVALEKAIGRPPSVSPFVPDAHTVSFPSAAGGRATFPSVSGPCDASADTEECRKP